MTSSPHGSYVGLTLQWPVQGCKTARWSQSQKPASVRIEFVTRLHEVGIASTADQQAAVNTFPALTTAVSHESGSTRSRCATRRQPLKVRSVIGAVVTR